MLSMMGNKHRMERSTNIALVPVEGDVDVTTAPCLRRMVDALVAGGCRRIVLNMADVGYIDSAGVGLLLGEMRAIRSLGGLLSIVNASPCVMHTLRICRLVDLMPVSWVGERRTIEELDPSAEPLWRCSLRVNPMDMLATRAGVRRRLSHVGLTSDELFDLTLAVGEAMGNAVDHACCECSAISMACYSDRVVVDVTDCGCGFDAREVAARPHDDVERGRGIRLMRLLTDSVTIARRPSGTGTIVRLVKLLGQTSLR
ncbi:histidine kinase-like ATPase domain protein [Olsenella profusa F0195]|uniref:Anti-sigma factor antagonist n=2 Tax=Olsenella profusa TaxID=138595 RepID=U2V5E8_9ACTN|nr:histidine kinase-like ATPase domain protein [Olsenella profusa F0195]